MLMISTLKQIKAEDGTENNFAALDATGDIMILAKKLATLNPLLTLNELHLIKTLELLLIQFGEGDDERLSNARTPLPRTTYYRR